MGREIGCEKFGGVPERSKGSDCKSDGYAFEGSNPSPTTIFGERSSEDWPPKRVARAVRGYGSMVEPQPSKLKMRVRFPLPAPISHAQKSVKRTCLSSALLVAWLECRSGLRAICRSKLT